MFLFCLVKQLYYAPMYFPCCKLSMHENKYFFMIVDNHIHKVSNQTESFAAIYSPFDVFTLATIYDIL